MQLDLRTVTLTPLRNTFSHIAKRLGSDKPASRYQEATYDIQATYNFHYRPLWAPEYEIFDASRTAIKMDDWYKLLDPRQFYYGTYTLARARMQEAAEADFSLVEDRNLAAAIPDDVMQAALDLYVPLRHVEWGANTNCCFIAAYGYGAAITSPAMFQSMDHLGIAQYLTRLGLVLDGPIALDQGKEAWLNAKRWQPLRKYIEDSFVLDDWFELYIAQALVLDSLHFPLAYEVLDERLSKQGAGAILSMLTRFQAQWFAENVKWVNAVVKIAAAESPENAAKISEWTNHYTALAQSALTPIAEHAVGNGEGSEIVEKLVDDLGIRVGRLGITLEKRSQ